MQTSRVVEHGRKALTVVFWTLVVGALVLGAGQRLGRWQLLEVQGGSMQPTIANGSLLLTTPQDADQARRGDIVSLISPDGLRVTHRVVDVDPEAGTITTRGDANSVNDAQPYEGERVDLVRVHVPGVGVVLRLLNMLLSSWVIVGGLALAMALCLPLDRLRRSRENSTEVPGAAQHLERHEVNAS